VFRALALATVVAAVALVGGCAVSPFSFLSPTDCMTRVMYFESNRSSAEGMLAVGTVVMNRLHDPKFPDTVCGVVGQKNQFAPGVLYKPMSEGRSLALARQVAERVLAGARHPGVKGAKFFHTQGYSFPYTNMHYVLNAGGNSFYEKR
jgi:spore germination cell wall hydrolase CwlJ-like protein